MLHSSDFYSLTRPLPRSTLFPYTTLFRSGSSYPRMWSRHLPTKTVTWCRRRSTTARGPKARCASSSSSCRSEEHTSELQSLTNLVCRLLLEKKNKSEPYIREEDWIGSNHQ